MKSSNIHINIIILMLLLASNFACKNNNKLVNEASISKSSLSSINDSFNSSDQQIVFPLLKYTTGIRSIFEDSKGNYWIGSHQEGVCKYDGETLTYYTTDDGLSDNQVRKIQEDKRGTIWFGTGNGISSFENGQFENRTPNFQAFDLTLSPKEPWEDSTDHLWFDADNQTGCYRYDGSVVAFLEFPDKMEADSYNLFAATGFSRDQNGHMWIATYPGIFEHDGDQYRLAFDDESLGFTQSAGGLHVRSILSDSKGNLWIGNNGIGVLLFDGKKTINFSKKYDLTQIGSPNNGSHSPPGTLEHVFAITEDKKRNIWFGDRDTGLWKFDGNEMINYIVDDQLSSPFVHTIYENKKGELLIGMFAGGIYQFNGESFDRRF